MKKQLLVVLSLGVMLATASAYAQDTRITAKVPFDFTVAGKTLPAGEYLISRVSTNDKVLAISCPDERVTMLAMPNNKEALNPAATTELVFNHRGNRYFLSQIWVSGSNAGREFPQGKLESELALDYPAERVVLLANLR
ncbi:MAG TPA: hypothetical protein VGF06_17930 [Terriglobales bacterium]|jgi:hypothetical protein